MDINPFLTQKYLMFSLPDKAAMDKEWIEKNIDEAFKPYKDAFNSVISKTLSRFFKEYPSLEKYPATQSLERSINVLRGGKRFRAIVAALACEAVSGYKFEDMVSEGLIDPLVWVEFLHVYTLFLDDVMDEDKDRRGFKSGWYSASELYKHPDRNENSEIFMRKADRYGVSMGILDGLVLKSLSSEAVLRSKLKDDKRGIVLRFVERANKGIALGQKLDIEFERQDDISEEEYDYMSMFKTGILYYYSALSGAVLGDATPEQTVALGNYSVDLASAFQNKDDLISSGMAAGATGKPKDSDIKQGKKTKLYILARHYATEDDRTYLDKHYGSNDLTAEGVEEIRDIFKKSGAVAALEMDMKNSVSHAIDALYSMEFNDEPVKKLANLAAYQLVRQT